MEVTHTGPNGLAVSLSPVRTAWSRLLLSSAGRRSELCNPERKRGGDSYLVDPASSHMLVSKIKPCMSKYKLLYGETANGSLNQLSSI